ncbi:hypothetical protein VTO73DRAFT_13791 [Trametes versicolor]
MSSSTSAVIAELLSVYEGRKTSNYINVAVPTLLAYDALLCIGKEVRYVWRSPKKERKRSVGHKVRTCHCIVFSWLSYVLEVLTLLGPAVFTTLRVYALSGRNVIVTGLVLVLSMGPFLVNVSTMYQEVPINLPPPFGCSSRYATNTIAVVVTWWRARTARQITTHVLRRSSLEKILWENGNIYFCTLVAMNIGDMIIVVLSLTARPDEYTSIIAFVDPISSILSSRFLLALYETNVNLERGGTSVSSFSTLDFGGLDRAAGSPQLPEFLTSLAGPIQSVPDDDDDPELFDSEPTAQHRIEAEASTQAAAGTQTDMDAGVPTVEVEDPRRV